MKTFRFEGNRLAYRDEGDGPVVLFVHGTPSSSAEFAEVIEGLRGQYRCIAVDHLGFGQSDKPQDADYSIAAHTRRLVGLLRHLGIGRFHLVAHDFGGPISLAVATERWDDLQSLTLMNTWAWALAETEPAMKWQAPLMRSALMKTLYLRFNFSARVLVKAAWGKHRPLTAEKHQEYQRPFGRPSERMGTVAFLDSLFDISDPAWALHKELSHMPAKPTLLLWGTADPLISVRTLERWRSIFPKAEVRELERVGHFVADEAPELVAEALRVHPGNHAPAASPATVI